MLEIRVESIVKNLIAEVCGVAPSGIATEGRLIEYGLDSVRAMDLLISLEEHFALEVPDDVAHRLRTVSDVTAYVLLRLTRGEATLVEA